MSNEVNIREQIQNYLIESGNYENISNKLTQRLIEDGWVDKMKIKIKQEIMSNKEIKYNELLNKMEPEGHNLLNEQIKNEIINEIQAILDEIIEQ
ncbi:hypothetical protein TBLA_0F01220 [Henningerozyma blattae CBS 6284]|uniref:Transcription and mRNA export factor SUS1 n=1 Tax=Henningerozyma blattae (strain ATCC 34711 / CBS 6284 / DSM 70876 / NBRC 10599 / NRRL Y-10934 / UCD 77-7) TaxID=1071380 RepID=I2H5L3_HENB6|nr:hypothetical protein TBLA_0F01220 [Tetrapisispora blattae CBS 6284]CCH61665.1 hypothetical protein TBLA_0F01220 [Tetrapisispora blattae CBS 6284]